MSNAIYFQPPGINPNYCESGIISDTDPLYIWYYNEPCKILISDVKIISSEDVIYDQKNKIHKVKNNE